MTYKPEEIVKIIEIYSDIAGSLNELEDKMLETKECWYKAGKQKDWENAWGHFLHKRYIINVH